MELTEKTLSSQTMFDGRIIHVRRDVIELPNGKEAFREVVDHPGGVCVLALDGEDRGLIARPALHSARLELLHPVTGERLRFAAPMPADMAALIPKGDIS